MNVAEPDPYGLGQRHQARPHDISLFRFCSCVPAMVDKRNPLRLSHSPSPPLASAQGLGAVPVRHWYCWIKRLLGVPGPFQRMTARCVRRAVVARAYEGPRAVTLQAITGGSQAAHRVGRILRNLAANDGPSTPLDEIVLAPPSLILDRDVTSPARKPIYSNRVEKTD